MDHKTPIVIGMCGSGEIMDLIKIKKMGHQNISDLLCSSLAVITLIGRDEKLFVCATNYTECHCHGGVAELTMYKKSKEETISITQKKRGESRGTKTVGKKV